MLWRSDDVRFRRRALELELELELQTQDIEQNCVPVLIQLFTSHPQCKVAPVQKKASKTQSQGVERNIIRRDCETLFDVTVNNAFTSKQNAEDVDARRNLHLSRAGCSVLV
jgi:hypothetical protein